MQKKGPSTVVKDLNLFFAECRGEQ